MSSTKKTVLECKTRKYNLRFPENCCPYKWLFDQANSKSSEFCFDILYKNAIVSYNHFKNGIQEMYEVRLYETNKKNDYIHFHKLEESEVKSDFIKKNSDFSKELAEKFPNTEKFNIQIKLGEPPTTFTFSDMSSLFDWMSKITSNQASYYIVNSSNVNDKEALAKTILDNGYPICIVSTQAMPKEKESLNSRLPIQANDNKIGKEIESKTGEILNFFADAAIAEIRESNKQVMEILNKQEKRIDNLENKLIALQNNTIQKNNFEYFRSFSEEKLEESLSLLKKMEYIMKEKSLKTDLVSIWPDKSNDNDAKNKPGPYSGFSSNIKSRTDQQDSRESNKIDESYASFFQYYPTCVKQKKKLESEKSLNLVQPSEDTHFMYPSQRPSIQQVQKTTDIGKNSPQDDYISSYPQQISINNAVTTQKYANDHNDDKLTPGYSSYQYLTDKYNFHHDIEPSYALIKKINIKVYESELKLSVYHPQLQLETNLSVSVGKDLDSMSIEDIILDPVKNTTTSVIALDQDMINTSIFYLVLTLDGEDDIKYKITKLAAVVI